MIRGAPTVAPKRPEIRRMTHREAKKILADRAAATAAAVAPAVVAAAAPAPAAESK